MTRTPLSTALAAGWKPVPDSRAGNQQPPPGAVALYARGDRLAWLLETPRGFELDVGNAQSRLRAVTTELQVPLTLEQATAVFEGMTPAEMDRAERVLDAFLQLEQQS